MQAVPILTYHSVACAPPHAQFRGTYVAPAQFRRQMRTLAWLGYRGLSLRDGLPYLRGERSGRVAILTFDDGYRDTLAVALPELRRHGFTATCYFVADRLGAYNDWDADVVGVRKPLMDAAEVRAWSAAGMDIGSHSCTHPRLTRLSRAEQLREIAGSKRKLEAAFGVPVEHFCYPYGDFDAACAAACREAGYLSATTVCRGRARAGADLFALRRVGISGQRNWLQFLAKVATPYEDRRGAA